MTDRLLLGVGVVWSAAALYAAATGRLLSAIVCGLTAAVALGERWLIADRREVAMPELHWPGVITMRCESCGDLIGPVDSPEVEQWCDTVAAHFALSHELTPSVELGLDVYRAAVMLHAQLASDDDR